MSPLGHALVALAIVSATDVSEYHSLEGVVLGSLMPDLDFLLLVPVLARELCPILDILVHYCLRFRGSD